MTFPPKPRRPLSNEEAGRLIYGAANVRATELEMALDIARLTHDDWVERDCGPAWFIHNHERGFCNMPFCDRCKCCGSQVHVTNVIAADLFMCRKCLAGDCKECRYDFEGF
jgi:hypothetical protein